MFQRHDHGTPQHVMKETAGRLLLWSLTVHDACFRALTRGRKPITISCRNSSPTRLLIFYKQTNKQTDKSLLLLFKKAFLIPPSETTKRNGSNEAADADPCPGGGGGADKTRRDGTTESGQAVRAGGKGGEQQKPRRPVSVPSVVHTARPGQATPTGESVMSLPALRSKFNSSPSVLIFALTNAPTVSLRPRFRCQTLLLRRTTAIFRSSRVFHLGLV